MLIYGRRSRVGGGVRGRRWEVGTRGGVRSGRGLRYSASVRSWAYGKGWTRALWIFFLSYFLHVYCVLCTWRDILTCLST